MLGSARSSFSWALAAYTTGRNPPGIVLCGCAYPPPPPVQDWMIQKSMDPTVTPNLDSYIFGQVDDEDTGIRSVVCRPALSVPADATITGVKLYAIVQQYIHIGSGYDGQLIGRMGDNALELSGSRAYGSETLSTGAWTEVELSLSAIGSGFPSVANLASQYLFLQMAPGITPVTLENSSGIRVASCEVEVTYSRPPQFYLGRP